MSENDPDYNPFEDPQIAAAFGKAMQAANAETLQTIVDQLFGPGAQASFIPHEQAPEPAVADKLVQQTLDLEISFQLASIESLEAQLDEEQNPSHRETLESFLAIARDNLRRLEYKRWIRQMEETFYKLAQDPELMGKASERERIILEQPVKNGWAFIAYYQGQPVGMRLYQRDDEFEDDVPVYRSGTLVNESARGHKHYSRLRGYAFTRLPELVGDCIVLGQTRNPNPAIREAQRRYMKRMGYKPTEEEDVWRWDSRKNSD